jgi:hypothetical protein
MAHHGDYILQDIEGVRELAGSDVNLVHRLMKNHVSEETGWRAYALFTDQSLEHMRVRPEGLRESVESYEHLGQVSVCIMDLHARYDELLRERKVMVEPGEAVIAFADEINAPPPVVWSWMNEPEKRSLFSPDQVHRKFIPTLRPGGRTRSGAITHCVHGKDIAMREKILDWKPFDYFTVEQDNGAAGVIQVTFKLEELEGARTRLSLLLKGGLPHFPAWIGRAATRFIYTRIFDYRLVILIMKKMIDAEMTRAPAAAAPLDSPA